MYTQVPISVWDRVRMVQGLPSYLLTDSRANGGGGSGTAVVSIWGGIGSGIVAPTGCSSLLCGIWFAIGVVGGDGRSVVGRCWGFEGDNTSGGVRGGAGIEATE